MACGRGARRAAVVLLGMVLTLAGCGLPGIGGHGDAPSTATPEPSVTPRTGPAETRTDVAYASASPRQTLDLYLPAGDGRTVHPLVVLIHGGGFFQGDKSELADRAKFLTTKGFAAASVDYRLSGDAPFPAGVQDVKAAVRYLRANARSWGVDPRRIGAWGESAGGYLATMLGVSAGEQRFEDGGLGNANVSSSVAAVVSWFGPADFATMDEQARDAGCDEASQGHRLEGSPESRWLGSALDDVPELVREADTTRYARHARSLPPFLLVHGEKDCTVAPGQSKQLRDALADRDARVELTLVPEAAHADPRIDDDATRPSVEFLRTALGSGRAG